MGLPVVCPDVIAEVKPIGKACQILSFFPKISGIVEDVKITREAFYLLKFVIRHCGSLHNFIWRIFGINHFKYGCVAVNRCAAQTFQYTNLKLCRTTGKELVEIFGESCKGGVW